MHRLYNTDYRRVYCYFLFELKKSMMVLKQSMISMLFMIGFITIAVTAVSYTLLQSQMFQKVNVAIAIPETEAEMKIVTRYLSNMDSVKNICKFYYYDEATAWEEMEKGNIQAIISFPENFFYDVYIGKNPPADIYFEETEAGNILVFQELLKSAISYLQVSESGVYASLDMAGDYETVIERETLGDYVAGIYAKQLLKREKAFEKEIVSPFGKYQYEEYFFSAGILIVLLMCGLQFGYLYQKRSKVIAQKLKIEGIGPVTISIVRIVVMAIVLWMIGILIYAGMGFISDKMEYDFFSINFWTFPGMLLLCVSIASYFHGVYALAEDSIYGTIIILMINIFMIISSGILIPSAYLPKFIVKIGGFTPFSVWNQFGSNLFFDKNTIAMCLKIIGISVMGAGIGAGALWKNT